MHKKIALKILTPQGIYYENEEFKIKIYGAAGVFELLPNHTNFMSILRRSIIYVYKNNNPAPCVAIKSAILQFNNILNTCTVISEFAISISNINKKNKNNILNSYDYENFLYDDVKKLHQLDF
jgi:F0F1-type ATP synthase epsilon subunit